MHRCDKNKKFIKDQPFLCFDQTALLIPENEYSRLPDDIPLADIDLKYFAEDILEYERYSLFVCATALETSFIGKSTC